MPFKRKRRGLRKLFGRDKKRSYKAPAKKKSSDQSKYAGLKTPTLPKSVANMKLPENKYGFKTPKGNPKAKPKSKAPKTTKSTTSKRVRTPSNRQKLSYAKSQPQYKRAMGRIRGRRRGVGRRR